MAKQKRILSTAEIVQDLRLCKNMNCYNCTFDRKGGDDCFKKLMDATIERLFELSEQKDEKIEEVQ